MKPLKPRWRSLSIAVLLMGAWSVAGPVSSRMFGREQATIRPPRGAESVVLSPDGKTLATWSFAKLGLWETPKGKLRWARQTIPFPFMPGSTPVVFSPDGKTLASPEMLVSPGPALVGLGTAINLRDVETGAVRLTIRIPVEKQAEKRAQTDAGEHPGIVAPPGAIGFAMSGRLAFSADGKTLAWAGIAAPGGSPIQPLDLHSQGKQPAIPSTIQLLDTETGRERLTIQDDAAMFYDLAFSPDGGTLVTVSAGQIANARGGLAVAAAHKDQAVVKLWDTQTGKQRASLPCAAIPRQFVAFSPDGKTLASNDSNAITLWDVEGGKLRWRFTPGSRELFSPAAMNRCMAFSPGGKTLVVCSAKLLSISLWDLETGKAKHTRAPTARDSTCSAVGLSPSGSVAAASLDDELGTVTLWDTATGRQLARFPPPRSDPPSYFMAPAPLGFAPFMFSHDESTLAAVSQPAAITITLFDVAAFTSQARSQPQGHSPPEPKPATKPESGRKSALRIWTSAGGGFTLQAEFVKAIGGTVYLKRTDGEEIQVPIERLSTKDQDFIHGR